MNSGIQKRNCYGGCGTLISFNLCHGCQSVIANRLLAELNCQKFTISGGGGGDQ